LRGTGFSNAEPISAGVRLNMRDPTDRRGPDPAAAFSDTQRGYVLPPTADPPPCPPGFVRVRVPRSDFGRALRDLIGAEVLDRVKLADGRELPVAGLSVGDLA